MYNEERKLEYIQEAKKTNVQLEQVLLRRFEETAFMEKKLNKDLCEWNVVQILDYYKSIVSRSLETLLMFHSSLNQYARWCLERNFMADSQNHFEEIDREILNVECINKAYLYKGIISRRELINLLKDDIYQPYEKFLVLATFEGLGGKGYSDFLNLTMDDFDGFTIHLPNRTIQCSKELIEYAKQSSNEYEYDNMPNAKHLRYFYPDDKRIIKAINGTEKYPEPISYRHRIIMKMEKIEKNSENISLNARMLFESGRLEMIKAYMKLDDADAYTVIHKRNNEIANQYGKVHAIERYIDKWSPFLELTD